MPRQYGHAPPQTQVAGRESGLSVRVGSDVDRLITEALAATDGNGGAVDTDCLLLIHTTWINESVIVTITDIEGNAVEGAVVSIAECP